MARPIFEQRGLELMNPLDALPKAQTLIAAADVLVRNAVQVADKNGPFWDACRKARDKIVDAEVHLAIAKKGIDDAKLIVEKDLDGARHELRRL